MHTTMIMDDDGREWVINHNGDWSGDVIVKRIEDDKDGQHVAEEFTLPGAIIRRACALSVVTDTIAMLEQWDGSPDAAQRAQDALAKEAKRKRKR